MPMISRASGRCWKTIRSFPERANITLAHIMSREHIVIRTWERGAGLTKACGSAACAAAVAAARLKRTDRKVTVTLPGGDLTIEWRESDDHVLMTGPVEFEFDGRFDPALFAEGGVRQSMSVDVLTFGCRLNISDSEVIRRDAAAAARRHDGGQYLRGDRRSRAAGAPDHPQLQREQPDARIVVTGCAAQTEPRRSPPCRKSTASSATRKSSTPRVWATGDGRVAVGDIMAVKTMRAAR